MLKEALEVCSIMNIVECLRVSIRGLSSNKMRTMLTMLGIIIGVAVVILVVAIGQGASKKVQDTINNMGTNQLMIWNGQQRIRNIVAVNKAAAGSNASTTANPVLAVAPNRLRLEDAQQIATSFTQSVAHVAPQVRSNVQIRMNGVDSTTSLTGTTLDYQIVNNYNVDRGRWFTQQEIDGSQLVCVAGVTIAEKMTGSADTDLTGKTISINRRNFTIVGMLIPKGSGAWGQDQDDVVICPITTAMRRVLNRTNIDSMSVSCTTQDMMPLAQEQISNYLRNKHKLQPPFPDNDDFEIRSQTELLRSQQSVTDTMTSLLSAVAVISLIVGGIGIMNIMLVSVSERTREIGIRKAIGATPRDILLQFLIESAIISILGGIIGIVLGVGGADLLSNVAGWNTIVNTTAIIAALVVSGGVGIFFGIYPASKAAALHPIQALRYE
jgi:putative ABC transport system permease protein